MLTVGDKFPSFDLNAVVDIDPAKAFERITDQSNKGKWKIVFFWPKDFTFVCPTEIAAFGKLNGDFNDRDAVVYGASIDSEFVHLAWRQNHADLKDLPFAMLADIKRELTTALGILDKTRGRRDARHLRRRSGRHHPLRVGDRPQCRPQHAGSPARARRPADR